MTVVSQILRDIIRSGQSACWNTKWLSKPELTLLSNLIQKCQSPIFVLAKGTSTGTTGAEYKLFMIKTDWRVEVQLL